MVGQEDRLSPLEVCVEGEHDVYVLFREADERHGDIFYQKYYLVYLFSEVEPHVESYLVVPAPRRMYLPPGIPDLFY